MFALSLAKIVPKYSTQSLTLLNRHALQTYTLSQMSILILALEPLCRLQRPILNSNSRDDIAALWSPPQLRFISDCRLRRGLIDRRTITLRVSVVQVLYFQVKARCTQVYAKLLA